MKKVKRIILALAVILFAILLMICKNLDNRKAPDIQNTPETNVSTESASLEPDPTEETETVPTVAETTQATEATTVPTETVAPKPAQKPSYSGSSGTSTTGSTPKETAPPATSPPATSPPATNPSASEQPAPSLPAFVPGEDETPGDLL